MTSHIYIACLIWHYPKLTLKLLDRWFDKMMEEIDGKP